MRFLEPNNFDIHLILKHKQQFYFNSFMTEAVII